MIPSLILITRPWYWLPTIATTFTGYFYNSSSHNPIKLFLIFLVSGGISAYAEALNDICDIKYDVQGSRKYYFNIPLSGGSGALIEGRMSFSKAYIAIILFAIVGLTASILLSPSVMFLFLGGILLASFYSVEPVRLKSRNIFAAIAHIIGYGPIAFFIGYFSTNISISWSAFLVSFLIGIWIGIVGLTADLLDFDDDKRNHISSLPVKLGRERTSWLIIVLSSALFLVSIIWNGFSSVSYLMLFVPTGIILFIYNLLVWRSCRSVLPTKTHGLAVILETLFPLYFLA